MPGYRDGSPAPFEEGYDGSYGLGDDASMEEAVLAYAAALERCKLRPWHPPLTPSQCSLASHAAVRYYARLSRWKHALPSPVSLTGNSACTGPFTPALHLFPSLIPFKFKGTTPSTAPRPRVPATRSGFYASGGRVLGIQRFILKVPMASASAGVQMRHGQPLLMTPQCSIGPGEGCQASFNQGTPPQLLKSV